jgi:hypothetical protein
MNSQPESRKVIQGPWPSNAAGRAINPDQRAGQYLPPETPSVIITSRYHEDYGLLPDRRRLGSDDRPVLQLNLPFPDMPTLGQIARDHTLRPREPRPRLRKSLPVAVFRYLCGWMESDWYRIDADRLHQDPNWYRNLDPLHQPPPPQSGENP